MSLSNASALQYFFKNEERNKNRSYSQGEKVKLVEGLAGRSRRECEVILAGLSPDAARAEKSRPISATQTELRITVGQELLEKLEKLKGLLSHRNPSPSMAELILMLADIALKQLDPDQKQSRKPTRQSKEPVLPAVLAAGPAPTLQLSRTTPPAECKRDEKVLEKSRYIPQSLRKAVWTRDHGQCTYLNPQTGVPCNSRHQIEIHHLKEFSLGGRHTLENTTLRCRPHNLHAAIETFGAPYMNQFLKVQTETFL